MPTAAMIAQDTLAALADTSSAAGSQGIASCPHL
jgi:hypothetical protein